MQMNPIVAALCVGVGAGAAVAVLVPSTVGAVIAVGASAIAGAGLGVFAVAGPIVGLVTFKEKVLGQKTSRGGGSRMDGLVVIPFLWGALANTLIIGAIAGTRAFAACRENYGTDGVSALTIIAAAFAGQGVWLWNGVVAVISAVGCSAAL